jgi:hypothetical protein
MARESRIPWSAPATVGLKRRNGSDYIPELFGLTLDEALDYATDPALPASARPCIWVTWKGREVVLYRRRIFALATRLDRPVRLSIGVEEGPPLGI